ncbi:MAG: hypothetical protein AAF891_00115 [Pseudomonadota bacterium]
MFNLLNSAFPKPVWDSESGGSGGTDGGGGGTDGGGGGTDGGDGGQGGGNWWEDARFSDDHRTMLTAKALTVDDPLDVVVKLADAEVAATRKLGKSPDRLIERPEEKGKVAEWLRQHGDDLGIPKDAEGYEIKPPENWPKDQKWDEGLEKQARTIAHEEGMTGPALNRMTELFAGHILQLNQDAETQEQEAVKEMRGELLHEWGDQTDARIARAAQAATAIAEKAGMTLEDVGWVSEVIGKNAGDAKTMRIFDAMADALSDGSDFKLEPGSGVQGQTPAEARAELARMRSKDGEWYKAVEAKDQNEMKRLKPIMDRLQKVATPGGRR